MTSADAASGTMRTVRFHENGEPGDVLRLESAAVPEPGPGRVRVAVRARGPAPAGPRPALMITKGQHRMGRVAK